MAVVLMEGFDHGLFAAKQWVSGGFSGRGATAFVAGRITGFARQLQYTSAAQGWHQFEKALPSTYTTLTVGFGYLFVSDTIATGVSANENHLFTMQTAAATSLFHMKWNNAFTRFDVYDQTLALVGSTGFVDISSWHYIEFKCVVNGAASTLEMRLDGPVVFGPTVCDCGSTAIGMVLWQVNSAGGGNNSFASVDDIYCNDTTGAAPQTGFLGDTRVETIFPAGAGNSTQWTPLASTNWSQVDEQTPDDDTSYVYSNTIGRIDTYDCTALSVNTTLVYGLQTNLYARKDEAGLRQIAAVVRHSGTNYFDTTYTLSTGYTWTGDIRQQDPLGTDWTSTTVDAAEFGEKVIA